MTLEKDIFELIDNYHNVLLYQQQDILKEIYTNKKRDDSWAFVTSPSQGKHAIEIIMNTLDDEAEIKNDSVATIISKIEKFAKNNDEKVIIFVNYLERLNRRTLLYYQEFIEMQNVYLIANIVEDKEMIEEEFLREFVIVDSEKYETNRSHSINMKYTILLILSLFVFLLFIRVQLSITSFLVSTLWFTLLMYRSFYYITR